MNRQVLFIGIFFLLNLVMLFFGIDFSGGVHAGFISYLIYHYFIIIVGLSGTIGYFIVYVRKRDKKHLIPLLTFVLVNVLIYAFVEIKLKRSY